MNHSNYILDFVIPVGPTGPMGPTGPTSIVTLISVSYNNTTTAGTVAIASGNRTILPTNSTVFTIVGNEIIINEDGYYEFDLSGFISDNLLTNKANLILKTNNIPLYTVQLGFDTSELYFSRTMIIQCNNSQRISLELNKQNSSSARVENIYLLIKKLNF